MNKNSTVKEKYLPLSPILHETIIPEKPVKTKKMAQKNGEQMDMDNLTKKRKKQDKGSNDIQEESSDKKTKPNEAEKLKKQGKKNTSVINQDHQNDDTDSDMLNIDLKEGTKSTRKNIKQTNTEVPIKQKRTKDKRIDKLNFFTCTESENFVANEKSKGEFKQNGIFTEELSPISSPSQTDKAIKKRKRFNELHSHTSATENILHKSKKAKLRQKMHSESTESVEKIPLGAEKKHKQEMHKKYEEPIQNEQKQKIKKTKNEQLANKSFEERLGIKSAEDRTKKRGENRQSQSTPGRDSPFHNLLEKLIKHRTKIFDEDTESTAIEITPDIEEMFNKKRKKNNLVGKINTQDPEYIFLNIQEPKPNKNSTEHNAGENKPKTKKQRGKGEKTPELHKKDQINSNETNSNRKNHIDTNVTDKTEVPKISKKKKIAASSGNEGMNIIEDQANIDNDKEGYINGIKLSTLQLSSLQGLIVNLPFEPHPVHKIETKLTNRPKPGQREKLKKLGYTLLTRFYSTTEDNKIQHNWKEFCERHTLDEDAGPFLVPNKYFPHNERVKFVRYLARGLEHRTLASVYKRFRLLFNTRLKKGKFSEEEDQIIFEHIAEAEQFGLTNKDAKVFAKLASALNRDRLQIEKHYILLCKNKNIKLSKNNCDNIIKSLLDVLDKEDIADLENCEITLTNWKTLEVLMDYPHNDLRAIWLNTIYPKLFYDGDRKALNIQKNITKILQEEEISDWKVADWDKIAERFQGQTGKSLYKSYKSLVYKKVPVTKQKDLGACLAHLTRNSFKRNSQGMFYKTALERICKDNDGVFRIVKQEPSFYDSMVI